MALEYVRIGRDFLLGFLSTSSKNGTSLGAFEYVPVELNFFFSFFFFLFWTIEYVLLVGLPPGTLRYVLIGQDFPLGA